MLSLASSPRRRYLYFDIVLPFNQLFGFIYVILTGYLFNTMGRGIKWPDKSGTNRDDVQNYGGVNLHGMFMSSALVFIQGEALLSYRLYRYDAKLLSKFIHFSFHILAIALFLTGFSAIVVQKNYLGLSHFTSVHSWIGLSVMFIYIVQFTFGFVSFFIAGINDETRTKFMPVHQTVGALLFAVSIAQAIIGFVQYDDLYNRLYGNDGCPTDREAPLVCGDYKFVYNFAIIFCVLYALTLLFLVVPPIWRRKKTEEETQ
ncbi:unnamed protein product [Cylicocyclus nassatus]|uniref:Cytochrome b561 domain-containing protein n=1 Tax=Cylicocyclus nassatus TaxID=53992 RepID=A0AA36GDI2_CYLNA|nr:unnamed protein product [Cylicocyclus nassatus]